MDDEIGIDVRRDGSNSHVTVSGDLALATYPRLSEALRAAVTDGGTHVELDLAGLEFMDSSGIQCIVHARNLAADYGGRLKVVAVSDAARRVLAVTGLLDAFVSGDPIR